jgi:hypothetical protein
MSKRNGTMSQEEAQALVAKLMKAAGEEPSEEMLEWAVDELDAGETVTGTVWRAMDRWGISLLRAEMLMEEAEGLWAEMLM